MIVCLGLRNEGSMGIQRNVRETWTTYADATGANLICANQKAATRGVNANTDTVNDGS